MPLRGMDREQMRLLPPTLDDLLSENHPARFVDGSGRKDWMEMGVDPLGAPAYHARALTDMDARAMRSCGGIVPRYNAQAVVSPVAPDGGITGMLVTAVDVVYEVNNAARLVPMVALDEEITGTKVPMTLADAGYFPGKHVADFQRRGQQVVMPDMALRTDAPFHKHQFVSDPENDSCTCTAGRTSPSQVGSTTREIRLGLTGWIRSLRRSAGSALLSGPAPRGPSTAPCFMPVPTMLPYVSIAP